MCINRVYAVMVFRRFEDMFPWQELDSVWSTDEGAIKRMMELTPRMMFSGSHSAEEAPPNQSDFKRYTDFIAAYSGWMKAHMSAYVQEMEVRDA